MFAIDDLDATVASLRARGAELVGDVAQYEGCYRLCYVSGPEGIIVALAEEPRLRRHDPVSQSTNITRTRKDRRLHGRAGARNRRGARPSNANE